MSAAILRQAAASIRERAEAAASELGEDAADPLTWRGIGTGYRKPIESHIASWHPAVALAVADWLDSYAERMEVLGHAIGSNHGQALAVATAYLGEQP